MSEINQHSYWMNRALVLARRGFGHVHPNPMVGAVVLDVSGKLVGQGYHEKFGGPHAEVIAFKQAGEKAKGGTLYVTLEPCSHYGKTPPCVEAILASGVKRVVVAALDPNPKVNGQGMDALRKAGIEVVLGVENEKALNINKPFFHRMKHQRPFIRAKVAMTVDGYLGHSEQRLLLSSRVLEKTTMKLRAQAQAIIIGVNTVIQDQPRLNVRGQYSDIQPIRVIVDSTLRTSPTSEIFEVKGGGDVWIFCDELKEDSKKWNQLEKMAKLVPIKANDDGKISPQQVVDYLGKNGITSILIEGGPTLLQSFSAAKLIDEWVIYLNSKNLGEIYPKEKLIGFTSNPLFSLEYQSVIKRGEDLLIMGTSSY
jgi:diaminohydroxyphosphoribosylaminopyrimidine deaminase/5-amino-6-(5-phosphoribosylamino)uracil reductase